MKRILLLLACCAACKSGPAPSPAAAPSSASVYKAVADAPDRSEADRKLDAGRKPVETLEFLAVKPGMKVEDLGAGPGYTTELLARTVGPSGVVFMQNDPRWLPFLKDALAERFTHPAMKGVVRAEVPFDEPVPAEAKDLDLVVMNAIYHDIVNMPVDRARMNQIIFNALRPGGAYVVIDNSAKDGSGLSATQALHRIDPQAVKEEVEKAGFKLLAEGSFLRNPEDARDWNASPGAATQLGKRGQSDRFALKFVRPEGSKAQLVPPHLRLPPGARPTRVAAELTVDPRKDEFTGVEEIELSVEKPLSILWLDADLIRIEGTEPASTVIDAPPFAGVQFAQPLPAGSAKVRIRWTGKLSRTDGEGAYRQQENGEWYVLTQGEPLGTRRVLPSFDEPSYKIPWRISLRVPAADTAFFNTPVESTEDSGGMKLFRFAETKPLPSYLLAFGVGPFERVDAGKVRTGEPVGVVVTKGKTSWARYSAQSSPKIMDAMGGFRDPALAQQGFGIAMSDEFDPRESIALVWKPSHRPRTREAALRFVQENFDAIVARMPRDYGAVLSGIADSFCDREHQEVLEAFFRPRVRKFPGGDGRYAQALEQVRQCAAFRAKAGPALTAWLSAPPGHAGLDPAN